MGQVGLGHCGVSIPEDGLKKKKKEIKKAHFGHGPGHLVLVCPSQAAQLDQMTSRDPFQNQLSSDSVTVICPLNC